MPAEGIQPHNNMTRAQSSSSSAKTASTFFDTQQRWDNPVDLHFCNLRSGIIHGWGVFLAAALEECSS